MSAGHLHNPGTSVRDHQAGLMYFLSVSDEYKSAGYDISQGQAPKHSVCVCSDSREDFGMSTGLVPSVGNTNLISTPFGQVLKFSNPGAFVTDPDGKVDVQAGKWLELSKHYGVNEVLLGQHSGCGQMNVIDTYHNAEGGENAIREGFGNFFADDAVRRARLVAAVKEKGFAHYEKMGIPLIGTDAQKRQQAMAIEQLIIDTKAVNELAAKDPKHYPTAVGMYKHIVAGKFYTFNQAEMKFKEVLASKMPERRHVCNCGHDHSPQ